MRLVSVNDLSGDEILARPIMDISGRRLLSQGVRFRLNYLNKLNEIGISSIYIEDEISEDIEVEDVLCDVTRLHAKQIVSEELTRFYKSKEIDTEKIQKTTGMIIEEVLSNKNDLINLRDIRIQDEYTFSHSVNVCILSTLLASKLGLPYDKIKSIGEAGLLHDFGKMLVPSEILNKPAKLTPEEFEEAKKHTIYGYNTLKGDPNIKPTVKVAVLMHHERLDGSGYPLGITGDKIHYSAKICAICDVFDAMTSCKIYRNALSISDAVEFLHSTAGIYFEKEYVDVFLKHIPIYPNGTLVLLNNGLIGIVIKNNKANLTRPVVRMLYNPKTKTRYGKDFVVDMMIDLTIKIEREIRMSTKELQEM